jgi:cation/acetate symporter
MPLHSQPFAGDPDGTPASSRPMRKPRNFLALMFCLMVGTAGLPHLLTRYYTAPSVSGRAPRWLVAVLHRPAVPDAPALAVLVKYEVMSNLVGTHFDALPNWMAQWARVDASLLSVEDINGDGILQFGEIRMGADLIMLATPELRHALCGLGAGGRRGWRRRCPRPTAAADHQQCAGAGPVFRCPAAAHGAGAAGDPVQVRCWRWRCRRRLWRPAFFGHPAHGDGLVLAGRLGLCAGHGAGHLLARHHAPGALAGMLGGLVALYYMLSHASLVKAWLPHVLLADGLWFGIQPVSAGVFGVPAGLLLAWGVSWLTRTRAPVPRPYGPL